MHEHAGGRRRLRAGRRRCAGAGRGGDQAQRQTSQLEGESFLAAPLAPARRRCGRAGAHGGHDPRVRRGSGSRDPAGSDRNPDTPAVQNRVEIEIGRTDTDIRTAARPRHGVVRSDDFPQDDRATHDRARLAQDFAFITAKHYSAQLSSSGIPATVGCQVGNRGGACRNCAPLQPRQADTSVWPMTTPPGFPSRPSVGRSSFAVAMKDYTFIRPGIAVTISAVTLALALVIGLWLIFSLNEAAQTVSRGARNSATLHRYNARLAGWRQMATSTDPGFRRAEAVAQRDSLGRQLRVELADLGNTMDDDEDRQRVQIVLGGLTSTGTGAGTDARQAMIVLLAKQDSALFRAAQTSQQAVLLSAILLALTIIAAGMLIVPMAWLYVRYKRGAAIEVKV